MSSVTVIRHWKERRSKCSLIPLEGREAIDFKAARPDWSFDATGFTVLTLDTQLLSMADKERPILLLDSTWRLLPSLLKCLEGKPVYRSLPNILTAYPRISKTTKDPSSGLASVEALYVAKFMLDERDDSLLDGYYWKDEFIAHLEKSKIINFSSNCE